MDTPCTEHAVLDVAVDRIGAFESAFERALPLMHVQTGFRWLRLLRVEGTPGRYVLLVGWDSREAHELGFRRSPEYVRWKELLHGFYDPVPVVDHCDTVLSSSAQGGPASR